eukprot:scaffold68985_cov35-Cyclotella_meneghiniana.AAC.2
MKKFVQILARLFLLKKIILPLTSHVNDTQQLSLASACDLAGVGATSPRRQGEARHIGRGREFQFISSSGVRFLPGSAGGFACAGGSAAGRLLAAGGSAAANACANEALLAASLWRLDC